MGLHTSFEIGNRHFEAWTPSSGYDPAQFTVRVYEPCQMIGFWGSKWKMTDEFHVPMHKHPARYPLGVVDPADTRRMKSAAEIYMDGLKE